MKKIRPGIYQFVSLYVFVALFFCIAVSCSAQKATHATLLALSKTDHTLAVVDASTLKVLGKIPVGTDPHEVIASSDGKTAYVTIYGGGGLHEINVIDLVKMKPLKNIDTRPLYGPHGITFVQNKVWFTAEGSKAVGSYDPTTGIVDWSMGTGENRTHMIYVTADAKRIYTTNVSSGTVSILVDTIIPPPQIPPPPANAGQQNANAQGTPRPVFGPREDWVQTIIPTAKGSEGFDVSPDSTELWTASSEDGTITIINLQAKIVTAKIDAGAFGANRLKFTPDGKLVFISSLRSGDILVYDTKTHKEIKRINIGRGAAGILMQPDGARVFIACTADNYVAVIDLATLQVTGKLDVGGGPDGLAWSVQ